MTIKALFLDMDETLCDTTGANEKALVDLSSDLQSLYPNINATAFTLEYIKGIYRELSPEYSDKLLPITNEESFRHDLIRLILQDLGVEHIDEQVPAQLQQSFDNARLKYFDFYPLVKEQLKVWRKHFTLVVITNGPEFSQVGKVSAIKLDEQVDHIIIGGQEPAQKPAVSIFEKALTLAKCNADEAVHIGDSLTADIFGANQSNIASVWVSHHQKLPENSPAQPDYVVDHPCHLDELIQHHFIA